MNDTTADKLDPSQLTPKQYRALTLAHLVATYNVTAIEAAAAKSVQWTNDEHFSHVHVAAQMGKTIPAKVLDRLTEGQRWQILHDYPDAHAGYQSPEVRRRARGKRTMRIRRVG